MPDENFSRSPNPCSGVHSGKAFGRHLGFRAPSCQLSEGLHSPAHIDLIQRFKFDIWHFGSNQHTLEQIYPLLEEGIVPFGGLNPHGNLRRGSPEEVWMETLACLRAARGQRLLLSSGTGTTPDLIPENVRMIIQTALSGVCDPKKAAPLEIKGTIAYFLNHFMPFCPL